jgi:hypothetical protein
MGEKERAEALLQAAGVTGVAVQTAEEQVTVSRVELEALRAGAQAPAETPGQAYVRQQQEQTQAAQLPEGLMSEAEMAEHEAKGDGRHAGMSHAEQMASVDRYVESAEYHARNGSI